MPNIEGYKLTNKGNALQIKVEAGKCKLDITKLKLGSGTASGDIVNLTDLVKVEQTVPISKIEVIDDYTCRITGLVTNQGLNKTYYIREIGLYAQDPDDGEILYLVAVDKNPDVMPADNYQMIISQEFNIDVVVSNIDSVNVTSQPVHLVTSDEVDEKIEEHNTSANPHENIFKRVLITEAKTAANTTDWNTLTESRTYKISGATFAADKHQPVGAVGTGELVVLKNGDNTIVQIYYANSTEFDKAGAYHRINIGGAWTDWVYNITNKGGTIENNLQINGKLVVPNVYVTEKLLIGDYDPSKPEQPDTSNFLTKNDLKMLQDRIISPIQDIYVNSSSGNDNNDGSTSSKAVRTLSKAYSLIKKEVPIINIILNNSVEGMIYEAEPLDLLNGSYSTERITFKAEINQSTGVIYPTIKLKYGKVIYKSGYHNGTWQSQYMIGNILYSGNAALYLVYLNIVVDTIKPINVDYRNFLCRTSNFNAQNCKFTLPKYTLMICSGNNCTFNLYYCNLNDNTDYFIRYVEDIPAQWEDEIDTETNIKTSSESAFAFALINGTTIPESIKSLPGSGIATSIGVIRKNWS